MLVTVVDVGVMSSSVDGSFDVVGVEEVYRTVVDASSVVSRAVISE